MKLHYLLTWTMSALMGVLFTGCAATEAENSAGTQPTLQPTPQTAPTPQPTSKNQTDTASTILEEFVYTDAIPGFNVRQVYDAANSVLFEDFKLQKTSNCGSCKTDNKADYLTGTITAKSAENILLQVHMNYLEPQKSILYIHAINSGDRPQNLTQYCTLIKERIIDKLIRTEPVESLMDSVEHKITLDKTVQQVCQAAYEAISELKLNRDSRQNYSDYFSGRIPFKTMDGSNYELRAIRQEDGKTELNFKRISGSAQPQDNMIADTLFQGIQANLSGTENELLKTDSNEVALIVDVPVQTASETAYTILQQMGLEVPENSKDDFTARLVFITSQKFKFFLYGRLIEENKTKLYLTKDRNSLTPDDRIMGKILLNKIEESLQ